MVILIPVFTTKRNCRKRLTNSRGEILHTPSTSEAKSKWCGAALVRGTTIHPGNKHTLAVYPTANILGKYLLLKGAKSNSEKGIRVHQAQVSGVEGCMPCVIENVSAKTVWLDADEVVARLCVCYDSPVDSSLTTTIRDNQINAISPEVKTKPLEPKCVTPYKKTGDTPPSTGRAYLYHPLPFGQRAPAGNFSIGLENLMDKTGRNTMFYLDNIVVPCNNLNEGQRLLAEF